MTEKLIYPPDFRTLGRYPELPVVFLAGPIQGAPDWQATATGVIRDLNPVCLIASPRRVGPFSKLSTIEYYDQVDWEHHHLNAAMKHGVVLFWLAKEETSVPGRSYAQTTRFELGEALALQRSTRSNIVVGIEDGFTNARYLRYTISRKNPGVQLCDSLGHTCAVAADLAGTAYLHRGT